MSAALLGIVKYWHLCYERYGWGANLYVGHLVVDESRAEIVANLCCISCSIVRKTGSGAALVVAKLSKEAKALTIGIAIYQCL